MIWAANGDHQKAKSHDQEMSHAVIELFFEIYRLLRGLVGLVLYIHTLQFRHTKLNYHIAIAITITCYCLTILTKQRHVLDAIVSSQLLVDFLNGKCDNSND